MSFEKFAIEIVMTALSFIVTGFLGFFVAKVKDYKKREEAQKERDKTQQEALKCILRSNITSKYYVYTELGEIPYYEKENIDKMHEQYKKMGGNSYVDIIVAELNKLPIKK